MPEPHADAPRPLTRTQRRDIEAWRLHRENGHPEGYRGPCWGPTLAERAQAKENVG